MKKRLDILMVEHGLALNRSKAQALIMSGVVFVDSVLVDKAGQNFLDDINIEIAKSNPFVSRGGLKLLSALEKFKISVADFICLDIGASTGGFTDCLLQNGAKKVYAVDVGKAQLDFKLRQDKRVVSIEQINFRYFDINLLKDIIDFVTIDVSFISLDKILPIAKQCV
ncbi:MAG: TlyA family RNA methyltransferase, partial [Elusimicrobiota bacterium]|nr:TlyA family RNA methyltransferase [Elusimicrobiota bacterium]